MSNDTPRRSLAEEQRAIVRAHTAALEVLALIEESGPVNPCAIATALHMEPRVVYAALLSFVRSDEEIAVLERPDGLWQTVASWTLAHPAPSVPW